MGGGPRQLPGGGRLGRRRQGPVDLGHVHPRRRPGPQPGHRRRGVRLLPPVPRGHRAGEGARLRRPALLDLVAARPPRGHRPGQRGGPRLLRPGGRRLPRQGRRSRGSTLYHWDLPAGAPGPGRLGQPRASSAGSRSTPASSPSASATGSRTGWSSTSRAASCVVGHLLGVPRTRHPQPAQVPGRHPPREPEPGRRRPRCCAPTYPSANVGTTHIVTPMRSKRDTDRAPPGQGEHRRHRQPDLLGAQLRARLPGRRLPADAGASRSYIKPGDDEAITVDWDFIGVQYYQRQLVKPWPIPKLRGVPWMSHDYRNYEITAMGWEVQPDGLYEALERFARLRQGADADRHRERRRPTPTRWSTAGCTTPAHRLLRGPPGRGAPGGRRRACPSTATSAGR